MTRIIIFSILCVMSAAPSWGQTVPKIKYTISNGLQIEGIDQSNAFIYDNDMLEDTPEDEYLWLKYNQGKLNLVGNIITRNMDRCNLEPCKYSMQNTIDQWNKVVAGVKGAGIKMINPTIGSDVMLEVPSSLKIEDTKWKASAGADLIIQQALKCTKEKPLVILVGGQTTTVANAYLKNPSIADKIVVFHIKGYVDRPTVTRGFNTIDAWAAYVVMKKIRYINFAGDLYSWYPGKNVNLTQTMINSLPNNYMCNSIRRWYTNLFAQESLADAPPALYFYNHSLWKNVVRKLENGQTTTSDNFDYLLISANDWTNYGPELVNYLKDPNTYLQSSNNKPPAINLTSPASNSNYQAGASINITANASDPDGSIAKVEFFNGTVKLGEDATSPYSFQWTNVPAGTHSLTAKATDNQNATTTSGTTSVTVASANTSPGVSITSPSNNTTFVAGSNVNINATASDANGTISKVEFYQGTTKLGEDLTSPYAFQWTNVPAGSYALTAKATDNQGATTTSSSINIKVNAPANAAPTVSLTSPASNASFSAGSSITLSANAADKDGSISKIEFYQGTTKVGEDLTNPYTFQWTNVPAGSYALTAKATDNKGATTTSSSINIKVSAPANAAPTVSLTSPASNASFSAGSSITLSANAADKDGSISKIEFYQGTTKLGEDLTNPYTFQWTNVPAGSYALTAKATDNQGATTTSSSINIKVNALGNSAPTVTITNPGNNASFTVGSTVKISADAADKDGNVSKVEFYQGTTKLGEDMVSPYTYEWTNVAVGNYSITAKAIDDKGVVTTSTAVKIVILESNNVPSIVITAPDHEATFVQNEPITIFTDTKDSNGIISKVEFYIGESKIGESITAPYTFVWSDPTIGNHSITAKASNNQSVISVSLPISISVVEPVTVASIEIISPVNNITIDAGSSIEIIAETKINNGAINKVEFYNGDQKLSEDLTRPFSYIWSNVPSGNHELIAKATTDQNTIVESKVVHIVVPEASEEAPLIAENIIPRYFTPNDDGLNDVWEFSEHELLENARVMVFNRSGQKIYEGYTYQDPWDGKLEGKPLKEDAYYYVIRLSDSNDIKGAVRIIR